ncbi:MAG: hypothetical protein OEX76_00040 [Candidatus Bathyarchaeota archaeon]|nr:hypothetical protein [Candidatus Bathyarchaeota archaeon]MDH5532150.1 hypothetical protein [Candidatus Bathyarchaeota archaeon]MDH5712376.1 hypothetical protein [Candidatus Bathyarchaeota archaeon]
MAQEKKGHAKITVEIEINEALMEVLKESMTKMPEMMKMFRRERKHEE